MPLKLGFLVKKQQNLTSYPSRESNPGLLRERQLSYPLDYGVLHKVLKYKIDSYKALYIGITSYSKLTQQVKVFFLLLLYFIGHLRIFLTRVYLELKFQIMLLYKIYSIPEKGGITYHDFQISICILIQCTLYSKRLF